MSIVLSPLPPSNLPSASLQALVFHLRLLRHLEKQQVSQFSDVLQVGDAVIPQDVAQVPEFLDNISRCVHLVLL